MKKSVSDTVSVNFHLTRACNYRCKFCFATFRSSDSSSLTFEEKKELLKVLRNSGTQKINFVGGEPTLVPELGELLKFSKSLGMVTSVVTNGFRLKQLIDEWGDYLDWVGLSIDSGNRKTNIALGRGHGDGDDEHLQRCLDLAELCHKRGINLKINTVVTALNYFEDMSELILKLRPKRWKIFQVLRVEGENDGKVEDLLISKEQFLEFVERHSARKDFKELKIDIVPEFSEDIIDSYLMINPSGRAFGNSGGSYRESEPILKVGIFNAIEQVGFNFTKLLERNGLYKW